jgi:predicted aspartyl protease
LPRLRRALRRSPDTAGGSDDIAGINDTIRIGFTVDSGAADVVIPADVVMTLLRTGTLRQSDFLEKRTYVLADGSKLPSVRFRLRSLKVGNTVLENVTASVSPSAGDPLLGQSFLGRVQSWSIDNARGRLVLE